HLIVRTPKGSTVYWRLTSLISPDAPTKLPGYRGPFCYNEADVAGTMRNLPYQKKWQVDWFRSIFDRYYDYGEGWYNDYERAVNGYKK
ncbi:MAG: hypothetical protein IJC68_03385, partial [Firmicutes bacterium]|nr:hypothetical protein [Bacillota bacterium]